MCGIFGMVRYQDTVDRRQVESLTNMLRHRGPDAEGFYFSPPDSRISVGLGHRRLSIIDLSPNGHQPMSNEDGNVWIVFNGEIYNFHGLRKAMIHKGHQFRSETDTETIIHLYEEYGPKCLSLLRGMFAFVIWDVRRQILFAARDRLGKKPFYYAATSKGFYFSSEINPLYDIADVGKQISTAALDLYMSYGYIPSPHTILEHIHKLPPAHYLILDHGKIHTECYWELTYAPKLKVSFEEARRMLADKIREATQIRLFSDVPLGCFLSGGVDSSVVLAQMASLASKPVQTFSIGFPDQAFDETPYARRAAGQYRADHREFVVQPANVAQTIAGLVEHYGEPFGDASALPTWYLSAMTRRHVTVALNGDGGDELFAGYNWYATAVSLHQLAAVMPKALAAWMAPRTAKFQGHPRIGRKLHRLMELIAKNDVERFADLRLQLADGYKRRLYSASLNAGLNGAADQYLSALYASRRFEDELDRMLYVDTRTYLPEELLVKVDRATMAHALEGRSPLLDHELVELAARLPSAYKYHFGRKKRILKKMAGDLYSPALFRRPKSGFSVPLKAWFSGDLEDYARQSLAAGALSATGWFDMGAIRQILQENKTGFHDHGDLIWRLLMLSEWCKRYA
jgi:asparagine synthase (glutamine-hydrolysing)